MKIQATFITSLGTFVGEPKELSKEDYPTARHNLNQILSSGEYMEATLVDGTDIVLSKDICRSCIVQIKVLEE